MDDRTGESGEPAATPADLQRRMLRHLQAGVAAEMGFADAKRVRRWQTAVKEGEFRPDDCAKDLLETVELGRELPRMASRSSVLLRDLLMAPLLRGGKGAGRKARTAAKSGAAAFVSQIAVTGIYVGLVVIGLLLARMSGVGIDALLDRMLFRS